MVREGAAAGVAVFSVFFGGSVGCCSNGVGAVNRVAVDILANKQLKTKQDHLIAN
ncbi:hypothetical protein [Halalkalibacter akibai]|uniref:Uncharacterized protein n=1 Tax=Halalkalibacter akibai (strain ATCC 43226 / DSM 21942 / CIP 109018 / JCM 9157 / 1139) TaxID=1236973 RepID=W4QW11_HALA3|nr:hypothetical protein [Halalkalibacter akibai]GAE35823.1 hypothetical protein JCM9157_2960 [Halalkalibacter akibai JCM 9157]